MKRIWPVLLFATVMATPAVAAPKDYAAAVAEKGRDAKAVAQDASRHPAEVLDFLGLKPGMQVLDVMAGGGYYSQIAGRVVGKRGTVIAFEPSQFVDADARATWANLMKDQPNLRWMVTPLEQFQLAPNSFDFTLLHLTYHDFYWSSEKYKVPVMDPSKAVAQIYAATRPGGVVGVIDHVGPAGDTRALVDKLHRIDPQVIKDDFAHAGFVLEAESDVLRVPGDDINKLVFDPAVRGKTDRVVLRFRKPG